jgi:preprotein translocase subunit YajC
MDFFISPAYAQADGGSMIGLLFPILLIVIFYFLLIRPQTKRAKEHRTMVSSLGKGDEIITQGGVLGKIIDVGETFLTLDVGDGLHMRVHKEFTAKLMPKGTLRGKEPGEDEDARKADSSKKK